MRRLGRSPDREDHRQSGALLPQATEVVVRRRVLERGLERRVADQELCLRVLTQGNLLGVGEEHARQHDRGRGLGRDRDGADALERRLRDQLDRLDGSVTGDTEARQQPERVGVARVLDRRDRRNVELAGDELPVELCGDADDLVDFRLEPKEDRRHVDVADAAELDQPARSTTAYVKASSSSRCGCESRNDLARAA